MSSERPGPFRLHVAIDRGTGPVYVLLHGINSTGHDWDTVVTAIGFDHRCIAVDELGYGESPKPPDIAIEQARQRAEQERLEREQRERQATAAEIRAFFGTLR